MNTSLLIHIISNPVSSYELCIWLPVFALPCEFYSEKLFRNKFEGKNPFYSLQGFVSTFHILQKLHSIKDFSLSWADLLQPLTLPSFLKYRKESFLSATYLPVTLFSIYG